MEFGFVAQQKAVLRQKVKSASDEFFALFKAVQSQNFDQHDTIARLKQNKDTLLEMKGSVDDIVKLEDEMLRTLHGVPNALQFHL